MLIIKPFDIVKQLIYTHNFAFDNESYVNHGQVAQLVEQRTENPRVGGSTPSLATNIINDLRRILIRRFSFSDQYVTKMLFRIEIF